MIQHSLIPLKFNNIYNPKRFSFVENDCLIPDPNEARSFNEKNLAIPFGTDSIKKCFEYIEKTPVGRMSHFMNNFQMNSNANLVRGWCFSAKHRLGRGHLVAASGGICKIMKMPELYDDPLYTIRIRNLKLYNQPPQTPSSLKQQQQQSLRIYNGPFNCVGLKTYETGSCIALTPDYRELECTSGFNNKQNHSLVKTINNKTESVIEPNAEFVEYWLDSGYVVLFLFLIKDVRPGEIVCVDRKDMWRLLLLKTCKISKLDYSIKPASSLFSSASVKLALSMDRAPVVELTTPQLHKLLLMIDKNQRNFLRSPKLHHFSVYTNEEMNCVFRNITIYLSQLSDKQYINPKLGLKENDIMSFDGNIEYSIHNNYFKVCQSSGILYAKEPLKEFEILGCLTGKLCLVKLPCDNTLFLTNATRIHGFTIKFDENSFETYGLYQYRNSSESILSNSFEYISHVHGFQSNIGIVEYWNIDSGPILLVITTRCINKGERLKMEKDGDLWWSYYQNHKSGKYIKKIPFVGRNKNYAPSFMLQQPPNYCMENLFCCCKI